MEDAKMSENGQKIPINLITQSQWIDYNKNCNDNEHLNLSFSDEDIMTEINVCNALNIMEMGELNKKT